MTLFIDKNMKNDSLFQAQTQKRHVIQRKIKIRIEGTGGLNFVSVVSAANRKFSSNRSLFFFVFLSWAGSLSKDNIGCTILLKDHEPQKPYPIPRHIPIKPISGRIPSRSCISLEMLAKKWICNSFTHWKIQFPTST